MNWNKKYSWQFKLFILYVIVGVIITYVSFAFAIQTDDIIFTIPMVVGLAILVSGIKIINMIPIDILEDR